MDRTVKFDSVNIHSSVSGTPCPGTYCILLFNNITEICITDYLLHSTTRVRSKCLLCNTLFKVIVRYRRGHDQVSGKCSNSTENTPGLSQLTRLFHAATVPNLDLDRRTQVLNILGSVIGSDD